MNRRKFIAGMATLPALPLLLKSCDWVTEDLPFPIQLHSDRKTGHLIFESNNFPVGNKEEVKTLIVGGGIAGLSAASVLNHQDFLLCELSDRLGGTSAALDYNGLKLAQGAHYDLEYPANYGNDVLSLLENTGLIEYVKWKDSWRFTDESHIIPHELKNQCYQDGKKRSDVLAEGGMKNEFFALMDRYAGKMPMPTRLIQQDLKHLNNITFLDFLKGKMSIDESFIRGLHYHMLDDWGGTANQVSALAGIHYFQCRPYYKEVNELFSPPQGNDYFVQSLAEKLPQDHLKLNRLVKKLTYKNNFWEADVIDVTKRQITKVKAKQVVYAGQKHALKYVLPEYYPLFETNEYAPWIVLNVVLNKPFQSFGFWQNEFLAKDQTFLGFIDSSAQYNRIQDRQVLTAYYCLPSASRKNLVNVEKNKTAIVNQTIKYISDYFGESITHRIESAFINTMGHAMPIPKPGYLFQNKSAVTLSKGLVFAGVDHHRLPLLFEAIDSGLEAVKALNKVELS
ncbi:MAG: FAD-dependent oxidoreductase [Bacteroidota bacterium]